MDYNSSKQSQLRPSRREFIQEALGLAALTTFGIPIRGAYASSLAPRAGSFDDSGGGFFSDPYASYLQFFVDPVNGNDSWAGTSQTPSAPNGPKQSLAAGLALLTAGGSCLNILGTGVLNVPANTTLTLPAATGTSPTAWVVIRGLPAATSAPQIVLGLNSLIFVNQHGERDYVEFRKLDISGSGTMSSPNAGACSLLVWLSDFACNGVSVQYCQLHDNTSQDITAGIRIEGAHTDVTFAYNKIFNLNNTVKSANGAGIITYQTPAVSCHHNEIYGCGCQIYVKRCSPATANNGWLIYKNYLHDSAIDGYGIYIAEQGGGDTSGFFDTQVTYNLFKNNFAAIAQNNAENTAQSSRFLLAWNTFAEDNTVAISFCAMTDITMHSNVIMAANEKLELDYAPNYVNTFTECDYNAYLTGVGDQWWLDRYVPSPPPPAPPLVGEYLSFPAWQAASGRPELPNGLPDAHGQGFTSLSANFPNHASGTVTAYALASGSALRGTGQGGTDPGYIATDCGVVAATSPTSVTLQSFGHNENLSSVSSMTAPVTAGSMPATGSVLCVVEYAASGTVSSVIDSNGNAFTAQGPEIHNTSDGPYYQVYTATNVNTSGTYSVTATLSLTQPCQVSFVGVSGGSTSAILAQAPVGAYLATGSPFSNPLTAVGTGNLVVGFISTAASAGDSFTAGTGFSVGGSVSAPYFSCACAQSIGTTTAGNSYNPNLSDAGGANFPKAVVFTVEIQAGVAAIL